MLAMSSSAVPVFVAVLCAAALLYGSASGSESRWPYLQVYPEVDENDSRELRCISHSCSRLVEITPPSVHSPPYR